MKAQTKWADKETDSQETLLTGETVLEDNLGSVGHSIQQNKACLMLVIVIRVGLYVN